MKVDLSKQPHQDNLKAEIYHQFRIQSIRCASWEIICEYKNDNCRFDLIIYDKETLDVFVIIEVRRIGVRKAPKLNGRKHTKYCSSGNVLYIGHFHEIDNLFDCIEAGYVDYLQSKKLENVF